MSKSNMRPIHPGEILLEEFLKPLEMTEAHLAAALGTSEVVIRSVCRGRRPINAILALQLARYWKTSPDLWLNMQLEYNLKEAQNLFGTSIKRQIKPFSKTAWKKQLAADRKARA